MDALPAMVARLVSRYDPDRVVLFGSHARGDAAPSSDIDLLVVKRTERRFLDRLLDAMEALDPEVAVDLLVYTPEELEDMLRRGNPFVTRALEEGRDLYVRRAG